MTVETLIDLYGFTWGFYLFELLYELCQATGLLFIGFIKLYGSFAMKVSESAGEDWDAKSALPSVTVGTIKMFLIIVFCFIPLYPMEVSEVRVIQRQCENSVAEARFSSTSQISNAGEGSASAAVVDRVNVIFGGKEIHLPISMKVLFSISQWLKDRTIEKLPCNTDIHLFAEKINLEKITDPEIRAETVDFQNMCYKPAVRKARRLREFSESMNWAAAAPFMNTGKYYQGSEKDGFYATKPIDRFSASDSATEEGQEIPNDIGGYPSCYDWWNGDSQYGSELSQLGKGLGSQLYNLIDEDIRAGLRNSDVRNQLDRIGLGGDRVSKPKNTSLESFVSDEHKLLYFAYFTPDKLDKRNAETAVDYSLGDRGDGGFFDGVGSVLGWISMAKGSLENSAGATMIQKAMPFIKPIIIAFMLFAAPLIYVISGYQGKTIATIHVAIGTILFWPAIWAFARNVDDNVRETLGLSVVSTDNMMVQSLAWSMFAIGPLLFTTLMSWAGYAASSGIDGFSSKGMAQAAGSAGKAGGKAASGAAGDAASAGGKKLAGIKGKR